MLSQKAKYAIKTPLALARAQDENLLNRANDISAGWELVLLNPAMAASFRHLQHHQQTKEQDH